MELMSLAYYLHDAFFDLLFIISAYTAYLIEVSPFKIYSVYGNLHLPRPELRRIIQFPGGYRDAPFGLGCSVQSKTLHSSPLRVVTTFFSSCHTKFGSVAAKALIHF